MPGIRTRLRTFSLCHLAGALTLIAIAIAPSLPIYGTQASTPKRTPHASFPLTKFYDTPSPLPPAKPGELIRSVAFDDYDLPLGVAAVRFLYHSRSANGDDVAASGVVLFPDRKAPLGSWPVVAWAHGLTGVARQCAPSLSRHLPHTPLLSMYVNLGYAVVAPDYTGLGTSFRHAWGDNESNALDVIYAVAAARRAVPQLGTKWVALGGDNGGNVAITVAELQRDAQDSDFLGSIAVAPLEDLQDLYPPASTVSRHLALLLAYGIKTVYPEFRVTDILTGQAIPFYEELAHACEQPESGYSSIPVLNPNWQTNHVVQNYFERNRAGRKVAREPLLVVSSESDPMLAHTTAIVVRLCAQGDRLQFEKYPEYDPGRVIGDSIRDQIAWIQARFAGLGPAPSNCARQP